jgi:hypothetical protein
VWGGQGVACLTFARTCATFSCTLAYAYVPQVSAARFEDNALSPKCGSSQETRRPRVWAVGVMVAMGRAVWIVACVCLHLMSLSILAVGLAVRLCLFVFLNMYACRYYVYAYIHMCLCYSLLTIYPSIICIDLQSVCSLLLCIAVIPVIL